MLNNFNDKDLIRELYQKALDRHKKFFEIIKNNPVYLQSILNRLKYLDRLNKKFFEIITNNRVSLELTYQKELDRHKKIFEIITNNRVSLELTYQKELDRHKKFFEIIKNNPVYLQSILNRLNKKFFEIIKNNPVYPQSILNRLKYLENLKNNPVHLQFISNIYESNKKFIQDIPVYDKIVEKYARILRERSYIKDQSVSTTKSKPFKTFIKNPKYKEENTEIDAKLLGEENKLDSILNYILNKLPENKIESILEFAKTPQFYGNVICTIIKIYCPSTVLYCSCTVLVLYLQHISVKTTQT